MWFNLCDILRDPTKPCEGEGPFYTDYLENVQSYANVGIEYVDWNQSKYSYLFQHKDDLVDMFNLQFKYREIGAETEVRFQDMIQTRFNQIADKYNHAYKVTEENDVDKLGTGYTYDEVRNRVIHGEATGTTSETRDSKYKDTPSTSTSTINNPTNQNIDDRDGTSSAENDEQQDDTVHQEKVTHDKEMVVELSELIDRYRQLDLEFVNEFGICFMGVM